MRSKQSLIFIIGGFLLVAISLVAAVALVKQRQIIEEKAQEGSKCPPGNEGQPGETCDNLNKCDIAGGCNPGCCATDSDCPSGHPCDIQNGYCRSGLSCNPNPEGGSHRECRDGQCVFVPGAGEDACTSHDQCRGGGSAECPYDVTPYVKQIEGDNSGFQLCNGYFSSVGCLKLDLPAVFRHCSYLAEAYTDAPNHCVSHTEAHLRIRRTITHGGTICLSEVDMGDDCVVQLDIRANQSGAPAGNLIAFKPNCGSRPTNTPTPTNSPTPTPVYSCECTTVKMYDQNWNQITDFSSLSPGDQVYLTVSGTTDHPQGLTRGRIRVNGGAWQETTEKHNGEFYISFTIPDYGDYEIEGQVYNPALGWR